jgi:hypothetical protein
MTAKTRKLLCGTRIYDDGGDGDRYTVCYPAYLVARGTSGEVREWEGSRYVYSYLCMSALPFHPQGVGQHGEHWKAIDRPSHKHLGRKIGFDTLPPDCQRAVLLNLGVTEGLPAPSVSTQSEL